MKKIYLLIAVCFMASGAFAQTKFGIKAGVNFAKMVSDEDDENDLVKALTSFQIGGYADIPLGTSFSVQPGLSLSGKGYKIDESEGGASYKSTVNLMYLEIPVNAVYKIGGLYLGAGPYAGFGLSGKYKEELSGAGEEDYTEEEDLEFGSEEGKIKGLDFGVNVLAGYQLTNGLNFGVNYGLGLSNLSNDDDSSLKNRVFSVTVGFSF